MRYLIFLFLIISVLSRAQSFHDSLAWAAEELTYHKVVYDPAYYAIDYPNGDIPEGKGVCTDVVIRAFRVLGIDLQKEVHEDMRANFELYPNIWGLSSPDPNIDHRRVPNLMVFFSRFGKEASISSRASDFHPGDIVCWDLGGGTTHIGLVSSQKCSNAESYLIVHNIGGGQVIEDVLFDFKIIGHYIYPNTVAKP